MGWRCNGWEFTGGSPTLTVHAYVTNIMSYLLLVPYGTIADPQVSFVWLQYMIQPHLAWIDTRNFLLIDMPWIACYICLSIFLYILLVYFYTYAIYNCLLAAWLLVYSWYLVIILRVHSKYSPFLGLAFYARFSARIIFYHSEELEWEVLGSVAQPEHVEWSRSEPLPLLYLPLPLNTLYIAMFGMMHYIASMAI